MDMVMESKRINGYNANRKSIQWVKPMATYAGKREAELQGPDEPASKES